MTAPVRADQLRFADAGEAADLVGFLTRLIHYDRAAVVRLQAGNGVLAVFGHPASFEVLAIRTARLAPPPARYGAAAGNGRPGGGAADGAADDGLWGGGAQSLDTTVSAGQLAEALDAALAGHLPTPRENAPRENGTEVRPRPPGTPGRPGAPDGTRETPRDGDAGDMPRDWVPGETPRDRVPGAGSGRPAPGPEPGGPGGGPTAGPSATGAVRDAPAGGQTDGPDVAADGQGVTADVRDVTADGPGAVPDAVRAREVRGRDVAGRVRDRDVADHAAGGDADGRDGSGGGGAGRRGPDRPTACETADAVTDGPVVTLPPAVTGPPWAGVLPPRGGWRRLPGAPSVPAAHAAVAAAVAEFRSRDGALPAERRTRAERDRIGREIWSRTLGQTELPLRAVHAAQSLGFLPPVRSGREDPVANVRAAAPPIGPVAAAPEPSRGPRRAEDTGKAADIGTPGTDGTAGTDDRPGSGAVAVAEPLALLAAAGWLRLRTPYGSVAVRRYAGGLAGLSVTPA